MLEAGFRTVDIIFGWNNVFTSVGHFCDNIINVLDSYYLWTPLKYTTVLVLGIVLGSILVHLSGHVVDFTELAERAIHDVHHGAGIGVYIPDKDVFIEEVLTKAGFEKGPVITDLTGKIGNIQAWKVKE
jgi:hypothetical protein